MFRNLTTFILGAGASAEVGLPVGYDLKNGILHRIRLSESTGGHVGCEPIRRALFKHVHDAVHLDKYYSAINRIVKALPYSDSIDSFLESHQNEKLMSSVSKMAIAATILDAERGRNLYYSKEYNYNTIDCDNIQNSWYVRFGRMLVECW